MLPIRLMLTEVTLVDPDNGELGMRWTLGPTWYANHKDEPTIGVAYYQESDNDGRFENDPEPLRIWAARMIARTTDYRVIGWDGQAPRLEQEHHLLEIWTTAGISTTYEVSRANARGAIDRLGNVNDVIAIPYRHEPTVIYVPVRSIASMGHSVNRTRVMND